MDDDYYFKAERLLDIISNLVEANDNKKESENPIRLHQNGEVIFSEALIKELTKTENVDLNDWAYKNVKDLF
jgi:hypothetical protein